MGHDRRFIDRVAAENWRRLLHPEESIFDQGLAFDLETLFDRRRVLKMMGLGGLGLALVGCGASPSGPEVTTVAGDATSTPSSPGNVEGDCLTIPEETAGPYPGDGSNGPDVLAQSGIVRRDIRSSFGELSGLAEGIPLSIQLNLEDATTCAVFPAAAVYLWQCDRAGLYSLYTIADQNYLRGVQEADADGIVRFTSIFPACYPGRWPHIHFEVYPNLDAATDDANKIATSQVALPEQTCLEVFATAGYEQSVTTLSQISLQTDNVFGDDGGQSQLGTVTGDIDTGYTVELRVPV